LILDCKNRKSFNQKGIFFLMPQIKGFKKDFLSVLICEICGKKYSVLPLSKF